MKILKRIGMALLALICLGVLVYFGSVLFRTWFPATMEPVALDTQKLFVEEQPQEEEPVEETPEELPEEEQPEEEQPEEEQPEEEQPEEEGVDVWKMQAQTYLQTMTLKEKLWQLFFTTPDDLTGVPGATQAGEMTRKALDEYPVGGLCYFRSNIEDRDQITSMLSGTAAHTRTPMFLAVDEEGGIVTRLSSVEDLGVTNLGPAADFGAAGDPNAVYEAAFALAGQMYELGFNTDFAPVADLYVEGNTEIATRAYSADPAVVAQMSGAMVNGLQENRVAACLKHFPGHGSAQSDTHEGKAISTRTLDELRQEEFVAFRQGIENDVYFVMMSHLTNENLSPLPASLSPEVVGLLRDELGFEGIVITDSLKMEAIVDEFTSADAAVMAIEAGCDMILMPNDLQVAYEGLLDAVLEDRISEERIDESVLRILTVKFKMGIME